MSSAIIPDLKITQEEIENVCKPRIKKVIMIAMIIGACLISVFIAMFVSLTVGYEKIGKEMKERNIDNAFLTLRGYWHMGKDKYLLIDESIFQISQFDITAKATELFKIKKSDIKAIGASNIETQSFIIKDYKSDVNTLNFNGVITINIIPAIGIMKINDESGNKFTLTKNNEMTNAAFPVE